MIVMEIPAHALGDQELWTPKAVKEALVEAFVTMERVTRRDGGSSLSSKLWSGGSDPSQVAMLRLLDDDQLAYLDRGNARRPNIRVTPEEISRAEAVLFGTKEMAAWLGGPMREHPLRPKLDLWIYHEVGKALGRKNVSLKIRVARKGWAERSFHRDVESAAGAIAVRLNRAGVAIWSS